MNAWFRIDRLSVEEEKRSELHQHSVNQGARMNVEVTGVHGHNLLMYLGTFSLETDCKGLIKCDRCAVTVR